MKSDDGQNYGTEHQLERKFRKSRFEEYQMSWDVDGIYGTIGHITNEFRQYKPGED